MESTKLTKKQKKALAFRERKGKAKATEPEDDNAVPVMENQDDAEDSVGVHGVVREEGGAKGDERPKVVAENKKRKRQAAEEEDESEAKGPAKTKKKRREGKDGKAEGKAAVVAKEDEAEEAGTEGGEGGEGGESKSKAGKQQRFILFVGKWYQSLVANPSHVFKR